jgi:hypothetical protein
MSLVEMEIETKQDVKASTGLVPRIFGPHDVERISWNDDGRRLFHVEFKAASFGNPASVALPMEDLQNYFRFKHEVLAQTGLCYEDDYISPGGPVNSTLGRWFCRLGTWMMKSPLHDRITHIRAELHCVELWEQEHPMS